MGHEELIQAHMAARENKSKAGKLYGRGKPKPSEADKITGVSIRCATAQSVHISENTIHNSQWLLRNAPELKEKLLSGELTNIQAFRVLEARGIDIPLEFRTDYNARQAKLIRRFLQAAIRLHEEFGAEYETLADAIQMQDVRERFRGRKRK